MLAIKTYFIFLLIFLNFIFLLVYHAILLFLKIDNNLR